MNSKNQKSDPSRLMEGFNLLGYIYNPLKQIFLANQPEKVISEAILKMDYNQQVLIVGGGADNAVIELISNRKCDFVTQVDISSVLNEKGRQRLAMKNPVWLKIASFVTCPFLNYEPDEKYGAILSSFYLDLFKEPEVKSNIDKMSELLIEGGIIVVTDFSDSKLQSNSNKWLIQLLYILFYPFTGVYRKRVPEYKKIFSEQGFTLMSETYFSNNLYQNLVFKKG